LYLKKIVCTTNNFINSQKMHVKNSFISASPPTGKVTCKFYKTKLIKKNMFQKVFNVSPFPLLLRSHCCCLALPRISKYYYCGKLKFVFRSVLSFFFPNSKENYVLPPPIFCLICSIKTHTLHSLHSML
jgi:hypothetical protein